MKQKVDNSCKIDSNNTQVQKQKERRIVSWSKEEDDALRDQIRVLGTDNWAIIASKFKDKTTRQCRRRWFTYLNSDFKKGGWSPEEDMLLCEAQKMYGNRWTEIAKVVSGRTDNAVKNRFTTLCKKMAKRETLGTENSTKSYINLNNKRILSRNGFDADGSPKSDESVKRIRTCISNMTAQVELSGEIGEEDHQHRLPFSVVARFPTQPTIEAPSDGSTNDEIGRFFLVKDDPKMHALMQQTELLSSLAIKVNSDKTNQSLKNVHEDYPKENKEIDLLTVRNSGINFQLDKFKEGSGSCWERDMHESSTTSSDYSTGSTLLSNTGKTEEYKAEISMVHQETGHELQPDPLDHQHCLADVYRIGYDTIMNKASDLKADEGDAHDYSCTEFSSPLHVTPFFRALAASIPSPQFSESEKHFLMKTLGIESPSPTPITNASHPPTCKRSLLHCL